MNFENMINGCKIGQAKLSQFLVPTRKQRGKYENSIDCSLT
jgi:hypothetical protein